MKFHRCVGGEREISPMYSSASEMANTLLLYGYLYLGGATTRKVLAEEHEINEHLLK